VNERLLDRLKRCCGARDFWRLHTAAARELTPLEVHDLMAQADSLPPETQLWLHELRTREYFPAGIPQLYRRKQIGAGARLYSDPGIDRSSKRLVIAFCGHAHRLMMPAPSFLQLIPSTLFDVLILMDDTKNHYMNGIRPWSGSLLELVHRVAEGLRIRSYQAVYTYGTSSGGLPALRAGLLAGAELAVSVGGRFPSHATRLIEGASSLPAFDPLCQCLCAGKMKIFCAYSEGHTEDRAAAAHLARIFPLTRLAVRGVTAHSPFGALTSAEMRLLFGTLFRFPVREQTGNFGEFPGGVTGYSTVPDCAPSVR
jgi:hypothetical protein